MERLIPELAPPRLSLAECAEFELVGSGEGPPMFIRRRGLGQVCVAPADLEGGLRVGGELIPTNDCFGEPDLMQKDHGDGWSSSCWRGPGWGGCVCVYTHTSACACLCVCSFVILSGPIPQMRK